MILRKRREYSHLKNEALDRTMWRAGFGRGFGSVVRQTAKRMNEMFHIDDSKVTSGLLNADDNKVVSYFETLEVHNQSVSSVYLVICSKGI
jgi:hypothetical protein